MKEFRPGSFQILPVIIKNLIIINVLFFVARQTIQSGNYAPMDDLFALHTWQSPLFKPWQFVTHLFIHGSWAHILSNMFALWMFGSVLENLWGPKRFLTFYIICGLGAALLHMIVLYFETSSLLHDFNALKNNFTYGSFENFAAQHHVSDYFNTGVVSNLTDEWRNDAYNSSLAQNAYTLTNSFVTTKLNEPTLGASGAVFGCLAAFGYLFPNTYIYIYFFLPLKAKWFVLIYAGFELVMALQNSAGDNVAHFAHLGGAIFGLALVYFWNKTNRQTFY
ncbi:rhomboid family intramembrane serine protease [Parafilimonas sp.]|uniref:rhomboid family intramembrane serine protease n=1 Tax=Parafilimonas sp. TaxID=1969739 RepID=UPI0039E36A5E